jgi:succinate dehydrogenase / fumarate reductase cytochrome b subunit
VSSERLRRRHAIVGLFPVGVFLFEHIVLNAKALAGRDAFLRTAVFVDQIPFWAIFEVVFIMVPLALHAGLGVWLMLDARAKKEPSPYPRSWRVLNEGAAWVALVFIAYHVWALRVPRWTHHVGAGSVHTVLVEHLSTASGSAAGILMPWVALFYLVGIAATVLHFAVGGWGYLVRFKKVTTPRATRIAAGAFGALAIVLFALASTTTISLASGSPVFVSPPPGEPCPSK